MDQLILSLVCSESLVCAQKHNSSCFTLSAGYYTLCATTLTMCFFPTMAAVEVITFFNVFVKVNRPMSVHFNIEGNHDFIASAQFLSVFLCFLSVPQGFVLGPTLFSL